MKIIPLTWTIHVIKRKTKLFIKNHRIENKNNLAALKGRMWKILRSAKRSILLPDASCELELIICDNRLVL